MSSASITSLLNLCTPFSLIHVLQWLDPAEQVDLLMAVITALQNPEFLNALDASKTAEEIVSIFRKEGL